MEITMAAIVIMAKEPKVGEVKTRLIPPLTAEMASELYLNFLLDKIQQVNSIENTQPCLAYYPGPALEYFKGIVPGNFQLIEQKGKNLGERLANVSSALLDSGHDKVVLVDSDSPNLPTANLSEGVKLLGDHDVVLGPCEDGGYYLVGIKRKMPELFQGIPWSTPDVTRTTLERAREMDAKIAMLETWYDVDTYTDLERLKRDLETLDTTYQQGSFYDNTLRILLEIFEDNK
jgi:rSAM/selenodomain-associated transferase 1